MLISNVFIIRSYIKARIFLRKIIGALFCKRFPRKQILALTSTRLSNMENLSDYFWGPLVKELDKRKASYKLIEYDQTSIIDSWKRIFKRYIPQKYDAQFIGTYYDSETEKMIKAIVQFLKRKFKELDKRDDFKESFTYQGIHFYEIIRERLKKIFLAYSWYVGDTYAIGKSVIKKEKPLVVLVDHEENFVGKALLLEANKQNIYSICLENEIIFAKRTKFLHEPIKAIQDKKSPLWRPFGNRKLVHGAFSEKWFHEKNQIPLKSLKIVGNPKYDFLSQIKFKDKKVIIDKYQVKPNEKLVTIISGLAVWEQRYLNVTLRALSNFKNLKIIVKMHPEDPDSNKKIVKGLMNKYKIRGDIAKYENTSLLIYASDFIISCNSTVVFEGILLKKNIMVFEPGDRLGWSWVEEGLIKPFTTSPQLEKDIEKVLNNKKVINPARLEEFIRKYFYSDDGKASQRAVNEIMKTLEFEAR
jgi:hypothetical protein